MGRKNGVQGLLLLCLLISRWGYDCGDARRSSGLTIKQMGGVIGGGFEWVAFDKAV